MAWIILLYLFAGIFPGSVLEAAPAEPEDSSERLARTLELLERRPLTVSLPSIGKSTDSQRGARSAIAGDLNDDGLPDIVIAYSEGEIGRLALFLANHESPGEALAADPGLGFQWRLEKTLPAPADHLALGDFDGDGDLDLAAMGHGNEHLHILRNDGTGSLAAAEEIPLPGKGNALASGSFLRRSASVQSLAVAVDSGDGPRLVLFESLPGEASADSRHESSVSLLPGMITAFAEGRLDADRHPDLVALIDGGAFQITWTARPASGAREESWFPELAEISVPASIESLAVGNFLAGITDELAFIGGGNFWLVGLGDEGHAWEILCTGELASPARALARARLTGTRTDDLVVMGVDGSRLHLLSAPWGAECLQQAGSFAAGDSLIEVLTIQESSDPFEHLVAVGRDPAETLALLSRPHRTWTVTTTEDSDDGFCDAHCTLREALRAANEYPGRDRIAFAVGSVSRERLRQSPTIRLHSPLPEVEGPVLIDATIRSDIGTRPGIVLDGSEAGIDAAGLVITAGASTVRGLAIRGFTGDGIVLRGFGVNVIQGNHLGASREGQSGNGGHGLAILSPDNVIGAPAQGNLIAGNGGAGIAMLGSRAAGNRVEGNRIGASWSEAEASGNASGVVFDEGARTNVLGGSGSGAGNLIAFQHGAGVKIGAASENLIESNVIRHNGGKGVEMGSSAGNALISNQVHDNGGQGVEVSEVGGPEPPVLMETYAAQDGHVAIAGEIHGLPESRYTVQVFGSRACDASGAGEGEHPLETAVVWTDALGHGNFEVHVGRGIVKGDTLTAMSIAVEDGSSAFSECITSEASTAPEMVSASTVPACPGDFFGSPITTPRNTPVNVSLSNLISITSFPSSGSLQFLSSCCGSFPTVTYRYTPNSGFEGRDCILYDTCLQSGFDFGGCTEPDFRGVTIVVGDGTLPLTVSRSGTGGGTVTSSPGGINCGSDCSQNYSFGTVVTLTAAPSSSSNFTGWSGGGCSGTGSCSVTMNQARTVTAQFTLKQHNLSVSKSGSGGGTVTSSPSGISCGSDCSQIYNHGTVVTLTAAPSSSSNFTGWSGGGCSGTGTCTVTMTQARSVTAQFTLKQHSLSVSKSGTGSGTVTSSPSGISCGSDCSQNYNHGTAVTLTATASSSSNFTGWSGGGCSGTGTCTVTMTQSRSVTAQFTLKQHSLTVSKSGSGSGTVTSSPSGINCGSDCSQTYNHGTAVTLTAAPTASSNFTGWSGGGCSGTGTCSVTMDQAKSVTAQFTLKQHSLTVSKSGTGSGTVASSPSGISCGSDCSQNYNHGTGVTLTASPSASSNFTGWSGGGCSGTGTCDVTLEQATTVNAEFTLRQIPLNVTKSGDGDGTITSSPTGISCGADCAQQFDHGTVVTLNAAPDQWSDFTGWSGGGCSGTSACAVTLEQATSVNAEFTLRQIPLNVTKSGSRDGTVTSSPSGISCGADCLEEFDHGTIVTLAAVPDPRAEFTGWTGGGCSGTAACSITLEHATNVNAEFNLVNAPPIAVDDGPILVQQDQSAIIRVLDNDLDPDNDALTVRSFDAMTAQGGTVGLDASGGLLYTPPAGFFGQDNLTYDVEDSFGEPAAQRATVTLTVNGTPQALNDARETMEGEAVVADVLANDSDPEGQPLSLTGVTTPFRGTAEIVDNAIRYTPATDFSGVVSVTYTIDDGFGGSDTARLTINVVTVNNPPDAVDDTATTQEDSAVFIAVLENDRDPENAILTVTAVSAPINGTAVLQAGNIVLYTPSPGFAGNDQFTYTVSDGDESAGANVNVTVTPLPDPPTAVDDSATTAQDTSILVRVLDNDIDPDGGVLAVTGITPALNGQTVIEGDGVRYTPNPGFAGPDFFTYVVSNSSGQSAEGSVSVTVIAANLQPIANDDSASTPEDFAVSIPVLANDEDPDLDPLGVTQVDPPANGTAVLQSGGIILYTPTPDFFGADTFNYTVSDGEADDTATVTVTVHPEPDFPIASEDAATTDQGIPATIPVLANDRDPDGGSLTVITTTAAAWGTVEVLTDGSLRYAPVADFSGLDSFYYTVANSTGETATARVTVTINAVNQPPVLQDDMAVTDMNLYVEIFVLANDSDPEFDPLTITGVSAPAHGTADNQGVFIFYGPEPGFTGQDTFTYTVSDGTSAVTAQVTVTVNSG